MSAGSFDLFPTTPMPHGLKRIEPAPRVGLLVEGPESMPTVLTPLRASSSCDLRISASLDINSGFRAELCYKCGLHAGYRRASHDHFESQIESCLDKLVSRQQTSH